MSDVPGLLEAAAAGNGYAAAELLPIVYDELRSLAAARMAAEKPGNTLDATGLVHEAYARLVGPTDDKRWDGRNHFFTAAAEAMRRVLVDRARGKARSKRGGDRRRVGLADIPGRADDDPHLLLSLDEALDPPRGRRPAGRGPRETSPVRRPNGRKGRCRPGHFSRYRLPELEVRPRLAPGRARREIRETVLPPKAHVRGEPPEGRPCPSIPPS